MNSNIIKIGARTIRVCKEAAIAILDYYYITDSLEHDKNTNKICWGYQLLIINWCKLIQKEFMIDEWIIKNILSFINVFYSVWLQIIGLSRL